MSKLVQDATRTRKRVRDGEDEDTSVGANSLTKTRKTAPSDDSPAVTRSGKGKSSKTDVVAVKKTKKVEAKSTAVVAIIPSTSSTVTVKKTKKEETTTSTDTTVVAVIPSKYRKTEKTATKAAVGKKIGGPKKDKQSTVVYLGHIPSGFAEKEIYKFFAQFGEVKRVKLHRSKKTNGSKGYAFIEFGEASIAIVAAQAMNGYFLAERQLVCNVVLPAKLHKGLFARQKAKAAVPEAIEDNEGSEEISVEQTKKIANDLRSKQKKLKALGIDYDFLPI